MTGPEVLIVLILVSAGFIRGAFGFGDALVAMPLLAFFLPLQSATPLMAIAALLIAIVILATEWQEVEFRAASILIIAGMIGVPIGIWLIGTVDPRVVKSCLGCLLVGFSTWSLWKPRLLTLDNDRWAPAFGVVAGVLGGAYNTAGPPLVIYAALRRWPPQKFRAMMQAYCIVGSIWIITMHTGYGNVTRQTLFLSAVAAPFIVVSTVVGQRLTAKLATQRFVKMVFIVLLILGATLILSSLKLPTAAAGVPIENKTAAQNHPALSANHATISSTTLPATSVSRKSRPLCRYVNCS